MAQEPVIVNNPKGGDGGATAAIVGIVIIILVFIFFFYGLPRIRGNNKTEIQIQTSALPQVSLTNTPAQTTGGGY